MHLKQCRACGNGEHNKEHVAREMMFGTRDRFTYLECGRCGCLQLTAVPDDLGRYYAGGYYSMLADPSSFYRNPIFRAAKRLRCRAAVTGKGCLGRQLLRRWPLDGLSSLERAGITPASRILDAGCGNGVLLYELHNAGYRRLLGVDPFIERDLTYPGAITVRRCAVTEVDGAWDVIMFHHSFEHVVDPAETLRACRRLLAPGGRCVIRIPTVSGAAWRRYGTNWVQLDAPRHIFLHSTESLALLAARAGFRIEEVVYDSTALQFWGSEQYVQDISLYSERSYAVNPAASPFTHADIVEFGREAARMNAASQGDQAAFYLVADESRGGDELATPPLRASSNVRAHC